MKKHVAIAALSAILFGCGAETKVADNERSAELVGPAPIVNSTPADPLLRCVDNARSRSQDLRVGIGEIVDGTGARTFKDGSSTLLTQRPDMMFAVALSKTGVRVLNRNATKVAEWELAQSMEQRLGEGRDSEIEGQSFPYRPVVAGSMLGSTHFVTGALTEVNWNIYSGESRTAIAGAFINDKEYRISVALDLIVTDSMTTEIVYAQSYTKQIVGREVSNGLFRFFEVPESGQIGPIELFDISSGGQQNEPAHRAVRWLVELAAYDIAAQLTNTKSECSQQTVPAVAPDLAPDLSPETAVSTSSLP